MTMPSCYHRAQVFLAFAEYVGCDHSRLEEMELERDFGLQSLDLVRFALQFDQTDDLRFPFEKLEEVTTVRHLIRLIAGFLDDEELQAPRPAPAKVATNESGTWPLFSEEERKAC